MFKVFIAQCLRSLYSSKNRSLSLIKNSSILSIHTLIKSSSLNMNKNRSLSLIRKNSKSILLNILFKRGGRLSNLPLAVEPLKVGVWLNNGGRFGTSPLAVEGLVVGVFL